MATALKTRIVLFGPPASGKGTMCGKITESFGISACSTGALLRAEIEKGTRLGREAHRFLSVGQLLPDDLMFEALRGWLESHRERFILDGFPRTVAQAEDLDLLLEGWNLPLEAAICLEVPEAILEDRVLKRVQCGECRRIFRIGETVANAKAPCPGCGGVLRRREDDTAETLRLRLDEYRKKTLPLVGHYRDAGKFFSINGDQETELVFKEIAGVLAREGGAGGVKSGGVCR